MMFWLFVFDILQKSDDLSEDDEDFACERVAQRRRSSHRQKSAECKLEDVREVQGNQELIIWLLTFLLLKEKSNKKYKFLKEIEPREYDNIGELNLWFFIYVNLVYSLGDETCKKDSEQENLLMWVMFFMMMNSDENELEEFEKSQSRRRASACSRPVAHPPTKLPPHCYKGWG